MGYYLEAMIRTTSNAYPIPCCPVTEAVVEISIDQYFLLRRWGVGRLTFGVVSVGCWGR